MRRSPHRPWLLAAWLMLVPRIASAQSGLLESTRMVLDTTASSTTTTITNRDTGVVTRSVFDNLFPRLTVNSEAMVTSNLRLSMGGVFEVNSLFSRTPDSAAATTTKVRPFVELRSTNAVFSPGVGYYRREERNRSTGFPGVNLVSEDYAGYLGWRPEGLPQTELQFIRTNTFDARRAFLDTTRDLGSIVSRYTLKNLSAYYLGTSLDTSDRRYNAQSHQVSHGARFDFSQSFQKKRGLWNASYNMTHLSVESRQSGTGGEVPVPIVASGGLSLSSDAPVTARLTPNPLLIDANLTGGAGVNIGLVPIGGDNQARNVGLDLLNPTEVSRLLVWIDRELPPEISNTFEWDVYSSPDNLLWTRETTVTLAPFGPFENRFQINFRPITARYLKIVTRPLSSGVQNASRYPDILVTELQAFVLKSPGSLQGTVVGTAANLNTDVRYRLVDSLFYEGSYWYSDAGSSARARQQLSNGVAINRRLGRLFSTFARGAREVGTEPQGHRTATVASATLTFDPLRTLTTSLLFTGRKETLAHRPNNQYGLSFQTNAQLYQGVDVQAGLGWNVVTRLEGEELKNRFVNVAATVVPRPDLTLTFSYSGNTTFRSGVTTGRLSYQANRALMAVSYDPFRTLHVVVSEEISSGDLERGRTFTDIGISWSPFPDGSLQFFIARNESLRPLEYGTERYFHPGVRWRFTRQSYVDFSYERLRTDFANQTEDVRTLGVTVRLFL